MTHSHETYTQRWQRRNGVRYKEIHVRVTSDQYALVERRAVAFDMTISDYMRSRLGLPTTGNIYNKYDWRYDEDMNEVLA